MPSSPEPVLPHKGKRKTLTPKGSSLLIKRMTRHLKTLKFLGLGYLYITMRALYVTFLKTLVF